MSIAWKVSRIALFLLSMRWKGQSPLWKIRRCRDQTVSWQMCINYAANSMFTWRGNFSLSAVGGESCADQQGQVSWVAVWIPVLCMLNTARNVLEKVIRSIFPATLRVAQQLSKAVPFYRRSMMNLVMKVVDAIHRGESSLSAPYNAWCQTWL